MIGAEFDLVVIGTGPVPSVAKANADQLHLEAAGLAADPRGRLKVNEFFQTQVPHIYAAGDVIGFPALASTSMEQGRLAASHMLGIPFEHIPDLLPYGIYTNPRNLHGWPDRGDVNVQSSPLRGGNSQVLGACKEHDAWR